MTAEKGGGFPVPNDGWRLDSIFAGGADSEAFRQFLADLDRRLDAFDGRLREVPPLAGAGSDDSELFRTWARLLEDYQELTAKLREAGAFARAQSAAHADDERAASLPRRVNELHSLRERIDRGIVRRFRGVDDALLEALADEPELQGLDLFLEEYRWRAARSMPEDAERLAAELNRDGLHAWGDFYQLSTGRLRVSYRPPDRDESVEMSVGRVSNKLSDADRRVRRSAHRSLRDTWRGRAPEFAAVLTSILGTRQTLMDRRGMDLLEAPLHENRIDRESLVAMMEAVEDLQPAVYEYLDAKADALGLDALEWYDLRAPVATSDDTSVDWEHAQEFVVEQVDDFSSEMAAFFRRVLADRWVEAEDREGKAQGGFCVPFPVSDEIRVFMTFGGTMTGVMTLAHELGHGYHFSKLQDCRPAAQQVPMTVAETASTLAEKAVESAALESADERNRFRLLDERLQRATTFLADIPARFQLERRMHQARRDGPLSTDALVEMTRESFDSEYGGRLESYDDYHWASKLHYYLSHVPFYNFPYTFGYLFSKAVHDRMGESGAGLDGALDDLLRESGRHSAETLADEFLGADLHDPDFWTSAASSIRTDVDRFVSMVDDHA